MRSLHVEPEFSTIWSTFFSQQTMACVLYVIYSICINVFIMRDVCFCCLDEFPYIYVIISFLQKEINLFLYKDVISPSVETIYGL